MCPLSDQSTSPGTRKHAARELWSFLALDEQLPLSADAIFVFGGNDLRVPAHAADLYRTGMAPIVLATGKAGPFSQDRFTAAEAVIFSQEMQRLGVPADSILLETEAGNTGENVTYGMKAFEQHGLQPKSLVLVAKPFLLRRCSATFRKQRPDIITYTSCPKGDLDLYIDRPVEEFYDRLAAEILRLDAYASQGFMAPVEVPDSVRNAVAVIRAKGAE